MQGSDQCYGQTWVAAPGVDRPACPNLVLIGIYGGILRLARSSHRTWSERAGIGFPKRSCSNKEMRSWSDSI